MGPLGGVFLVVVTLLAAGGVAKLARPSTAGDAVAGVTGLRLAGSPLVVRLLAAGEVAVAVAALGWGGRGPAALVALAYTGFTAFTLRARGRVASCGCFGDDGAAGAPPSVLHAVVTAAGVAVAGIAAARAVDPPLAALADHPAAGVALAGCVTLAAWL